MLDPTDASQLQNALAFAREDARYDGKHDDINYVLKLAETYKRFLLNDHTTGHSKDSA